MKALLVIGNDLISVTIKKKALVPLFNFLYRTPEKEVYKKRSLSLELSVCTKNITLGLD